MALPSRFAPPTRLDALRTLLGDYSERDQGFQGAGDFNFTGNTPFHRMAGLARAAEHRLSSPKMSRARRIHGMGSAQAVGMDLTLQSTLFSLSRAWRMQIKPSRRAPLAGAA